MSSWVAAIVKMPSDAYGKLHTHHVESTSSAVKPWLLIDCKDQLGKVETFGEVLARDLDSDVLAIVAQTNADAYGIWHFHSDRRVRAIEFSRDSGGWLVDDGDTQDWERALFFDPRSSTKDDDQPWPDTLPDDISDEDLARYEVAKKKGDSRSIQNLLHLHSLAPFERLCRHFDLEWNKPSAIWHPPNARSVGQAARSPEPTLSNSLTNGGSILRRRYSHVTVTDQLPTVPVSPPAESVARSDHVPFAFVPLNTSRGVEGKYDPVWIGSVRIGNVLGPESVNV